MTDFSYLVTTLSRPTNQYVASIKMDGVVLHRIENLSEFYKHFGYTENEAKNGITPDEFIWQEYVNNGDADLSQCAQMHIIEYLKSHSDTFRNEYGSQCKDWLVAHAKERLERGVKCVACKAKPICEDAINYLGSSPRRC